MNDMPNTKIAFADNSSKVYKHRDHKDLPFSSGNIDSPQNDF